MVIATNGFNNPVIGQSFSQLASLFAPPSTQDILASQKIASDNASAQAKSDALDRMKNGNGTIADMYVVGDSDPVTHFGKWQQQQIAAKNPDNLSAQDAANYANTGTIAGTTTGVGMGALNSDQVRYTPGMATGAAGPTTQYGVLKNGDRSTLLPNGAAPSFTDPDTQNVLGALGYSVGPGGVASISAPDKPDTFDGIKAGILKNASANVQQQSVMPVGGQNISVNTGKDIFSNITTKLDTSFDGANAAVKALPVLDRQEAALNKGIISGGTADIQTKARSILSGLTGIQDPGLQNTQAYVAAAQANVGNLAKTISGSGHTTNQDINVAKMIEAADPNYTEAALREIIRQQPLVQLDSIDHHNAMVDRFQQISPDNAKAADFYRVAAPQTAFAPAGRISAEGAQQPASASGPVQVQTPADVVKLSSGTQFVTPDGRVKVKP